MGPLAGGLGAGGLGLPGILMFEGPVQDLIDELGRLPGVGPKSAQRIAFHLLAADPADVIRLQDVLQKVKQGVRFCDVCGNVAAAHAAATAPTPGATRRWCAWSRSRRTCSPSSARASSRAATTCWAARWIRWRASGPIAAHPRAARPARRTGPAADETDIAEVIIATDPNTEGEATATYLVRLLRDFPGLTRHPPGSGLPMGGDLEFADELTLGRALSGRRAL